MTGGSTLIDLVAAPQHLARQPDRLWTAVLSANAEDAGLDDSNDRDRSNRFRRELIRMATMAPASVAAGLDRILLSSNPPKALETLRRLDVLAVLLPEVDRLYGFHRSATRHHKDLWAHTCQVIGQMPPDPDLRWAALLHDVGKLATRSEDSSGKVTFWHHEELGGWIARGIVARLMLPPQRQQRIVFIVTHHGRVNAYEPQWTDRAVARLSREMGAAMEDLIAFSRADFSTRRRGRREQIRHHLDHLEGRLQRLYEARAKPRLPPKMGKHVAQRFGLDGPELGKALRWLHDELVQERVSPDLRGLLEYLERGFPVGSNPTSQKPATTSSTGPMGLEVEREA